MSERIDLSSVVLTFNILDSQGQVTFGQLEDTSKEFIRFAIVHGFSIGMGAALMLLSWVIIINKRTPMFVLNQCSLLLLIIRSGLYLGYLLGPFAQPAFTFTGIYTGLWSLYNVSLAANVFYCMLVFTVETTMVFQVYVVFKGSKIERLGHLIVALCASLGLAAVGLAINASIATSNVLKAQLNQQEYAIYNSWTTSAPTIVLSVSINVLSVILILKLAAAIRTRRVLGMKQFDSFHILVITLTQTFIVPSILVIVNYLQTSTNLLSSLSFIIAVLNLPLGSLWASSSNNSPHPTSVGNTVLSRYTSSSSSQGTLTTSGEGMHLRKYITPTTADPEKTLGTAALFECNDLESLERILESLENTGVSMVTTNRN